MANRSTRAKARRNTGYSVYPKGERWTAAVQIGFSADGVMKRKTFTRKTEREARAAVESYIASVAETGSAPDTKATVAQWYAHWIDDMRAERSHNTVRYYDSLYKNHILPKIGGRKMLDITSSDLQQLINERSKKGLDPVAMRLALRTCFNAARRAGVITRPVADFLTHKRKDSVQVKHLTEEEIKRLLAAAQDTWIEPLVLIGLGTGMRIGEATGLTWQDISENTGHIRLDKQLQRLDGSLQRVPLKTHRREGLIPINKLAQEAISKARDQCELVSDCENESFVFVNPEGRPCDQKWVNKHLHRLCDAAEIARIGYHVLRHTAATHMIARGATPHEVMFQLGHVDFAHIARRYVHQLPETQRRAAAKLDDFLEELGPG